jgi:DNA polymerase III alpha subunit
MAAVLSCAIGDRDKIRNYIYDLKENKISLLPPSINHS